MSTHTTTCDSCGRDFRSPDSICPYCDFNNNENSQLPTGEIIEFENSDHLIECLNCGINYDSSQNWKCPSCGQRTDINLTGDQING